MAVEGAGVVPAKAAPLVRATKATAAKTPEVRAAAVRKDFMSMSFV